MIPKQDQPTPSEIEIDLEALMELSTEEQKTQLEVEWGTEGWALGPGVGVGSWAWTKGNPETQALPPWVEWGEPHQRESFLEE